MKFTQCARARLVDASFAEAPRADRPLLLASTLFIAVLVLRLVVIHPLEGITNLTNHQPRRLRWFHATGNLSAFSPGRLSLHSKLRLFRSSPSLDILPPFFLFSVLLGDALQTIYLCSLLACYNTLFQHDHAYSYHQ